MMGTWPTPWTDWLRENGHEVPDDIRFAYGHRAPGPEYEDGAPAPRPLVYAKEIDDTSYLTNRLIDYIADSTTPFIAHLSILRPHPPFVAPEPFNAMYDPQTVPGFARKETHEAEGAQHPWLEHQLGRKLFRAPEK